MFLKFEGKRYSLNKRFINGFPYISYPTIYCSFSTYILYKKNYDIVLPKQILTNILLDKNAKLPILISFKDLL